jgi:Ca2+-binding RTX toxin-like protein
VICLGCAGTASAGTVSLVGDRLLYEGAPGEANEVRIQEIIGELFFVTDQGNIITAGQGCSQSSPPDEVAVCLWQGGVSVEVLAGDLDDFAMVRAWEVGETRLDGGPGNDTLVNRTRLESVTLVGGVGEDLLQGGPGKDLLLGGLGNDALFGGGARDGLRGGGGADTLEGEAGHDWVAGGEGADIVRARDGLRDSVNGGPDFDRARIDRRLIAFSTSS